MIEISRCRTTLGLIVGLASVVVVSSSAQETLSIPTAATRASRNPFGQPSSPIPPGILSSAMIDSLSPGG